MIAAAEIYSAREERNMRFKFVSDIVIECADKVRNALSALFFKVLNSTEVSVSGRIEKICINC